MLFEKVAISVFSVPLVASAAVKWPGNSTTTLADPVQPMAFAGAGNRDGVIYMNESAFTNTNIYGMEKAVVVQDETYNWRYISAPFHMHGDHVESAAAAEQRYEIRGKTSLPFLLQPKIPISACVDTTHGSGGSVGKTVSYTLSSGVSGTAALTGPIASFVSLSTSYSISASLEFDFGVTCSADAGESVQMFIAPWQIEASTSYRPLAVNKKGGEVSPMADWSDFFASEWGINAPPETYCSTSKESCHIPGLDSATVFTDRSTAIP